MIPIYTLKSISFLFKIQLIILFGSYLQNQVLDTYNKAHLNMLELIFNTNFYIRFREFRKNSLIIRKL